jgi:hypothetical protein
MDRRCPASGRTLASAFLFPARALVALAALSLTSAACGGDDAPPAPDAGARDLGGADLGAEDLGSDLGPADLGATDLGEDAARPDLGPGACASDRDCREGEQWCEGGRCVDCDNSGTVCRIACPTGWSTYVRNGCSPCECAPLNACMRDGDCGSGNKCWPGRFCWCPDGARSPDCCMGNVCSGGACTTEPPTGCLVRGCPRGQRCDMSEGCAPSACGCDASGGGGGTPGYICTADCSGGSCVDGSDET